MPQGRMFGETTRGQGLFDSGGKQVPWHCRLCGAEFWRKDDYVRHVQSQCKTKATVEKREQ